MNFFQLAEERLKKYDCPACGKKRKDWKKENCRSDIARQHRYCCSEKCSKDYNEILTAHATQELKKYNAAIIKPKKKKILKWFITIFNTRDSTYYSKHFPKPKLANPFTRLCPTKLYSAEDAVAAYFRSLGYIAYKLSATTKQKLPKTIETFLNKKYHIYSNKKWASFCKSKGVPDLLIYKQDKEKEISLFFVECKNSDGLLLDQMKWAFDTNAPHLVAYAENLKKVLEK